MSYIDPATRFGFTLWNPTAGLALFLGLTRTYRAVPILFVAGYLAALIVRGLDPLDPAAAYSATILAAGYAALGAGLRRYGGDRDPYAHPLTALAFLTAAILGAGAIAAAHVAGLAAAGPLDDEVAAEMAIRTWIGDATGIAVLLPLLSRLEAIGAWLARAGRRDLAEPACAAGFACLLAGLALLGPESATGLAYLALLPVVWIAVRNGLEATILAVTTVQIAIATFTLFDAKSGPSFSEFQTMMIVIALTGPVLGAAIEFARRTADESARLRIESERLSRLTAMGALGAAIAHELSQPLAAIHAAAHVLARNLTIGTVDPSLRRAAATIESQIETASSRVRSLREDFQSAGPDPQDFDAVAVAHEAARMAESEWPDPRPVIRIERREPAVVRGDRQQVRHVLHNLFRNAFAATAPRGTKATIRAAFGETEDWIVIAVEDDGPGVAPDLAAELFEPMTSGRAGGVGLGLFIGRALAELNGGKLTHATPMSGRGARFELALPKGSA
ncbi:MAG: MASE1 domain-containing protein [Tagaea sp.]|nr:MASE1 domain-containing protein [Tagaea sp.]